MFAACQSSVDRLDLERKVLAAAFKLSFDSGDKDGAALAHKGLCSIIQQQLFSGDGSSGSVVPAGFWQQAQEALDIAESVEPPTELTESTSGLTKETQPETGTGTAAAAAFSQMAAAAAAPLDNSLETVTAEAEQLGLTRNSQLPADGPLNYLDFGSAEDDAPAAIATMPENCTETAQAPADMAAPPAAVTENLTPAQLIKTQSFYEMLGVNKLSSYERIHICFLRLIRMLLRRLYATQVRDKREIREVLRAICIAHDVLKDPVTRTDYDLRLLGMRSSSGHMEAGADGKAGSLGSRIRLMLGELLECASVLEPKELQIALDMHKAEPGVQFGEFLVMAGFLNREELDSALMAQRLIDSGKITVAQFQSAIGAMRQNGSGFFDTLMVEGWLTPRDVFDEESDLWKDLNGLHLGAESGDGQVQTESAGEETSATDNQPRQQESADWADNVEWLDENDQGVQNTKAAAKQQSNDVMQAALEAERALLDFIEAPDDQTADIATEAQDAASSGTECDTKKKLLTEESNSGSNGQDTPGWSQHAETDITPAKLGLASRLLQHVKGKNVEFSEKWTEKDAMAETQSIDMTAVKAMIDSHHDDND